MNMKYCLRKIIVWQVFIWWDHWLCVCIMCVCIMCVCIMCVCIICVCVSCVYVLHVYVLYVYVYYVCMYYVCMITDLIVCLYCVYVLCVCIMCKYYVSMYYMCMITDLTVYMHYMCMYHVCMYYLCTYNVCMYYVWPDYVYVSCVYYPWPAGCVPALRASGTLLTLYHVCTLTHLAACRLWEPAAPCWPCIMCVCIMCVRWLTWLRAGSESQRHLVDLVSCVYNDSPGCVPALRASGTLLTLYHVCMYHVCTLTHLAACRLWEPAAPCWPCIMCVRWLTWLRAGSESQRHLVDLVSWVYVDSPGCVPALRASGTLLTLYHVCTLTHLAACRLWEPAAPCWPCIMCVRWLTWLRAGSESQRHLVDLAHDLFVGLVDRHEHLGLGRQLSLDVGRGEDALKIQPVTLTVQPLILKHRDNIGDIKMINRLMMD